MKNIITCFIFLLFIGCTTLKDIRTFNPEYITNSSENPKKIYDCIVYQCQNNFPGFHINIIEKDDTFYITISSVGFLGVIPFDEITVKSKSQNGSIIELRSNHDFIKYMPNKLIEIINSCASPTPQITPAR